MKVTERCLKYIEKKKIKKIYVRLIFKKGPCNDNYCKIIPDIVFDKNPFPGEIYTLYYSLNNLQIFVTKTLERALSKNRKEIELDVNIFGRFFFRNFEYDKIY